MFTFACPIGKTHQYHARKCALPNDISPSMTAPGNRVRNARFQIPDAIHSATVDFMVNIYIAGGLLITRNL